ncbi:hypothetical protein T484DRAFT_1760078, partial [Baffinella frigidus]
AYCNCWVGKWFHLVGTYDGFNVKLHVTGGSTDETVTATTAACLEPPCGAIVYPSDFHPRAGEPTSACTRTGLVPVLIGNYTDRTIYPGESGKGNTFPHIGAIKHVTLYGSSLSRAQAVGRFEEFRDLWESPMHWQRHWVKSAGISPSIDYVSWEAAGSTQVTVRGIFRTDIIYSCIFQDLEGPKRNVTINATVLPRAGEALLFSGSVDNSNTGKMGNSDTLVCGTPLWHRGYARTRLEIREADKPLWQKTCVTGVCGHTDVKTRAADGTQFGWQYASVTTSPGGGQVGTWVGLAPIGELTIHSPGAGYASGRVILAIPKLVTAAAFDPVHTPDESMQGFPFGAHLLIGDGGGVERTVIFNHGDPKQPGNPGLVPVVVYGEDCAVDSTLCGAVQQDNTLTDIWITDEARFGVGCELLELSDGG